MATRLQMEFDLPDAVDAATKATLERALRQEAVVALFRQERCSAGFAAKLLGVPLADFLALLAQQQVPYSHESTEATPPMPKIAELRKRAFPR